MASYGNPQPDNPVRPGEGFLWVVVVLVALVLIIAMFIGGCAGIKAFTRAQRRADANNNVALTGIQIRNQLQYARIQQAHNQVVQAQAEQRYLEAIGIRRAQDEISKTLNPLYIQHEAIQAQQAIASSGQNNTVIYVPASSNGVPLVQDTTKFVKP